MARRMCLYLYAASLHCNAGVNSAHINIRAIAHCALAHPQLPSITRYLGQGQKGADDTTRRVEPKQMEGWQDVSSELLEEGILGLYIYVCCQTLGLKL